MIAPATHLKSTVARRGWRSSIEGLCRAHDLLHRDAHQMIRVPALVRGELRVPDPITIGAVEAAFAALDGADGPSDLPAGYARVGGCEVLREPIVDRASGQRNGTWAYSVLPMVDPLDLIEAETDALADELYDLPFEEVLDFVDGLRDALEQGADAVDRIRDATRATAELPDAWHEEGFVALTELLDSEAIRTSVDEELGGWGLSGTSLLDGWQPLPAAEVRPTPVHRIAQRIQPGTDASFHPRMPRVRAMPTRQLHITAGNAPQVPLLSALRAISTKSPAVIKSPAGAVVPGALLALAAAASRPDHPLTRHLSFVYWPGGDETIETQLLAPGAFDRIVVWGAPDAVQSIRSRVAFGKVLSFNPRFSVSLIGRESFEESDLGPLAMHLVKDVLVANQNACIATQVVYVEGDAGQTAALALALRRALASFDSGAPHLITPAQRGKILRLMKGVFVDAEWYANEHDGHPTSCVVVAPHEFPVTSLPMGRFVVLRRVDDLAGITQCLHAGVSTVSVFPAHRIDDLATRIGARGVSSVVPVGQSGSGFPGQSHDGMRVLCELVDWKSG